MKWYGHKKNTGATWLNVSFINIPGILAKHRLEKGLAVKSLHCFDKLFFNVKIKLLVDNISLSI